MLSNLKLIIFDATQFFIAHLRQIASLCLPWLLAVAVIEIALGAVSQPTEQAGSAMILLIMAFKFLVYPIYTAALILLMERRARQESPINKELLADAIKLWQPFFIMLLLIVSLIGFGLMLMLSLESLLQAVIGIKGLSAMVATIVMLWGIVRLSFAKFIIVLERVKPSEALIKSYRITGRCFIQIAVLLLIFIVPLFSLNILLASLLHGMGAPEMLIVVMRAGIEFCLLFVEVVLFRYYMSIIQEKPA